MYQSPNRDGCVSESLSTATIELRNRNRAGSDVVARGGSDNSGCENKGIPAQSSPKRVLAKSKQVLRELERWGL